MSLPPFIHRVLLGSPSLATPTHDRNLPDLPDSPSFIQVINQSVNSKSSMSHSVSNSSSESVSIATSDQNGARSRRISDGTPTLAPEP